MRYIDLHKLGYKGSNARRTQVKNTLATYQKIAKEISTDQTILDYGSGLGYGSRYLASNGYIVQAYEPYYNEDKGVFRSLYVTCDGRLTGNKYDVIICNYVLNVVPDDIRDVILFRMYNMLNVNGRLFITVRPLYDVRKAWKRGIILSNSEILTSRGTYQKGFTNRSLYDYVKRVLPDNAIIKANNNFSSVNVVVTKV